MTQEEKDKELKEAQEKLQLAIHRTMMQGGMILMLVFLLIITLVVLGMPPEMILDALFPNR